MFIVQQCIVALYCVFKALLHCKSALKSVVIGSITNIHMKNSVGVKIVIMIEP